VAVAFAAAASPAAAKRVRHRHRHVQRHLVTVVAPQQAQAFPNGWGVVTVSGSVVHLIGTPLDNAGIPVTVNSSPGMVLDLGSTQVFAAAGLCGQRGCSTANSPPGSWWIPVSANFLRSQDQVILGLAVTADTASGKLGAGQPVPVYWLYDLG
jgi:hypothetical protein